MTSMTLAIDEHHINKADHHTLAFSLTYIFLKKQAQRQPFTHKSTTNTHPHTTKMSDNNQQQQPGLVASHLQYVKGAAEVKLSSTLHSQNTSLT